jgi:hypothetical protein
MTKRKIMFRTSSKQDDPLVDRGIIARNRRNHNDQWYVARKYFEENFELASEFANATVGFNSACGEYDMYEEGE